VWNQVFTLELSQITKDIRWAGTAAGIPAWARLQVGEQILRYRQLATEALAIAGSSSDKSVKAAYLVMASDWHMLAAELEHDLDTAETREELAPPLPAAQSARRAHERRSKAGRAHRARR